LMYYPAALVKTRIQTATATGDAQYKSTRDAFRSIYRNEGFKGFYKGWSIAVLSLTTGPLYITTLEVVREKLGNFAKQFIANEKACAFISTSAGASTALIISTSIATPLEVVSQRLMIQRAQQEASRTAKKRTVKDIIKEIYAKEKLRGFYRAFFPAIANRLPTGALCWGTYPVYNTTYRNFVEDYWPSEWNGSLLQIRDLGVIPVLAGVSAGGTGAIVTFPLDLIRARIQVSQVKKTFIQTGKDVIAQHGIRGLYAGLTARILHLGFMYSLIMPCYEILKKISSN